MDIEPGESGQFDIKLPLPLNEIQKVEFQIEWECPGCFHAHEILLRKIPSPEMDIRFACPCCTPWYLKLRNFLFRRG